MASRSHFYLSIDDLAHARGPEPSLRYEGAGPNDFAAALQQALREPGLFERWRAGALGPRERIAVPEGAGQRAAWMRQVRTLRDHLHALLASRIDGMQAPADAVQGVDQWLHRAWSSQALGADGRMHWRDDARNVLLPLKRIALDALDLLGASSAPPLRRCCNTSSCGWLFLDTSKNQRRR